MQAYIRTGCDALIFINAISKSVKYGLFTQMTLLFIFRLPLSECERQIVHMHINETWEFSVKNESSHLLFNLYLARFSRLSTENNTFPVSTQVPFWFKWQIRRSGVLIKEYNTIDTVFYYSFVGLCERMQ